MPESGKSCCRKKLLNKAGGCLRPPLRLCHTGKPQDCHRLALEEVLFRLCTLLTSECPAVVIRPRVRDFNMLPNRSRALTGGLILVVTLASGLCASASTARAQDFLTNTLDKIFKPQQQQAPEPAPQMAPPAGWEQSAPPAPAPSGGVFGGGAPVPEQQVTSGGAPLPPPRPAELGGTPVVGGMATGNPEMGAPPAPSRQAGADIQAPVNGRATPATIQRITDYYNSVQSMTGTFTQTDPDGTRRTGDFYMQKPGRVRFQYDDPSPIELIANGQSVAVRDRRLNTQDITPLGQTPLRFLLAQQVDLARDRHVTDIFQDERFVTVVMQQSVPMVGTYRLLLLFDVKSGALKQWIITDPQGYDTQVTLTSAKPNTNPDPRLFVINFERMR